MGRSSLVAIALMLIGGSVRAGPIHDAAGAGEDGGGDLGVTDLVSGEVVLEMRR